MKTMEIGSEFWLSDIPTEYNSKLPDWIRQFGSGELTASGRGAISLMLENVVVKAKTVLLPAYICESLILPFIIQGYTCCFYDVNEDLSPILENLKICDDIGIFLHMGYYGFPTNGCLADIIKKFKNKGTIIVEDITHTLFSDFERFEENDYYVASIRKWIGLPSGGALISPTRTIKGNLQYNEAFTCIRREALLSKAQYMRGADELKHQYLNLFAKAEAILDKDFTPYYIDDISKTIINNLDVDALKEKRKANFRILSEGLIGIKYLEPVFRGLTENICPIFYPIYIYKKRREIRQILIEENIFCPIHWSMPDHIDYSCFKQAARIYNSVLSIPCDQRYEMEDMERVVSVLKRI